MGVRTRLVLLLGAVAVVGVVLTGWLALDVAEDTAYTGAAQQVELIRGVVGEFGGVSLSAPELRRQAARFQIGLAALDRKFRVLSHGWPAETVVDLQAALEADGRPDLTIAGALRQAEVANQRYWVGLISVRPPILVGPTPPGRPERDVGQAAWLAVCVPHVGQHLGPVVQVAVLGGAVLCAIAWLLLLPTVRRLGRLAEAARAVSGGDLERDVPVGGGDEIGVLAGAFREMLSGLRESRARLLEAERLAALGQIATAVAHEIRNPLAAIRMTVQLMGEEAGDPRLREDCTLLMREAARLELFLDDLLAFARPDPGVREPVALDGVVADVCDLEQARADHLGVRLVREVPAELPPVIGDRRRLVQVCANLVLNAIQAAGPQGRVGVAVAAAPDAVTLRVTDSGDGVPEAVADRLFTPFVTSKPNGTGLGLALSRRIAREHGGDLTYHRDGAVTAFAVRLPVGQPAAAGVA